MLEYLILFSHIDNKYYSVFVLYSKANFALFCIYQKVFCLGLTAGFICLIMNRMTQFCCCRNFRYVGLLIACISSTVTLCIR